MGAHLRHEVKADSRQCFYIFPRNICCPLFPPRTEGWANISEWSLHTSPVLSERFVWWLTAHSIIIIIQELRYSLRSKSVRARPLSRPGSLSWGKVMAEWPLIYPGPAPCHWHSPDWHQCLTPRWEPDTGSLTKYLPSEIQEMIFSICCIRLCHRILPAKTIPQPQEVLSTTG